MGHSWVTGRGSVQSGDDSSGEEQLHSLISLRLSTMSDHPCLFANIILAKSAQIEREFSTFSHGLRGFTTLEPNVGF